VHSLFSLERFTMSTWREFERDFARLLFHLNFSDVRLIGGSNEKGADILAVKDKNRWAFQCKFTNSGNVNKKGVKQLVEAKKYYGVDKIGLVTSGIPGAALKKTLAKQSRFGFDISLFDLKRILRLAKNAPNFSPRKKTLRDYQDETKIGLYHNLLNTGKGFAIMATGLGKTVVISQLVSDLFEYKKLKNNRVLVLAHTNDLVDQLLKDFWCQLPKTVLTNRLGNGEKPFQYNGITFSTIQTASLLKNKLPYFDLVVVDEAHRIGSESYLNTIDALGPQMICGVTATPWRGDNFNIRTVIGDPVSNVGIAEGLRLGYLAEVDYRMLADDLNWNMVQDLSQFDYSLKQLNRKLILPKRDKEAAKIIYDTFKKDDRKSCIVFSPTIVHAKSFAGTLRLLGLRAISISSKLNKRERNRLLSNFKAGLYDVVVAVDIFNEGVDVPDVDLIAFLRVTHSRRLFVQQLGRGLRISSTKDKVIVLDFVSDIRRIAAVLKLDKTACGGSIEKLGLGKSLVKFIGKGSNKLSKEWMLDQADFLNRDNESNLELPEFDYPDPLTV